MMGFVKDFGDLANRRDKALLAHAKTDADPVLLMGFLQRQARRQRTTASIHIQKQFKSGARLGHGDSGNQPASTAFRVFIRVSSSTGLVR